jgi:hypothetical protein
MLSPQIAPLREPVVLKFVYLKQTKKWNPLNRKQMKKQILFIQGAGAGSYKENEKTP